MERLVLLLLAMTCLCDAGLTKYNSNGSAISGESNTIDLPCGMINSSTADEFRNQTRITIGGSTYIEFPWIVALFALKPEYKADRQCALTDSHCWNIRCVASLISYKVVLTVGTCVHGYKGNELKARAGDWNLETFDEPHPYQERIVTKFIIHPEYNRSVSGDNFRYDVALLFVESPYIFADNIGFICLPPPNLNTASANCKSVGWGYQVNKGDGFQQLLKVVDMNYVDHDQCQRTLRELWWTKFVLHDSYTCAGDVEDKHTCQGGRGSPLICLGDDHYYARGLNSWGMGCGTANFPGVYTDVVKMVNRYKRKTSHASWDEKTMGLAIGEVKESPVKTTARKYGIPLATLQRHIKTGLINYKTDKTYQDRFN